MVDGIFAKTKYTGQELKQVNKRLHAKIPRSEYTSGRRTKKNDGWDVEGLKKFVEICTMVIVDRSANGAPT